MRTPWGSQPPMPQRTPMFLDGCMYALQSARMQTFTHANAKLLGIRELRRIARAHDIAPYRAIGTRSWR